MRLKSFVLLSGLASLLAASAQADLAFVLTPAAQSDVGSNEVIFTGMLINTSLTDNLFLNDIQFGFIDEADDYLEPTRMGSLRMFPAFCCPVKFTATSYLESPSPRPPRPANILASSPSRAAQTFLP